MFTITDPSIISIYLRYQQHWSDQPDLIGCIHEFMGSFIQGYYHQDGGGAERIMYFAGITFDDVMTLEAYVPQYLDAVYSSPTSDFYQWEDYWVPSAV